MEQQIMITGDDNKGFFARMWDGITQIPREHRGFGKQKK